MGHEVEDAERGRKEATMARVGKEQLSGEKGIREEASTK